MKRCIYSRCFRIGRNDVQSKYLNGDPVVLRICNKHYREYLELMDEEVPWEKFLWEIRKSDLIKTDEVSEK